MKTDIFSDDISVLCTWYVWVFSSHRDIFASDWVWTVVPILVAYSAKTIPCFLMLAGVADGEPALKQHL